MGQGQGSPQAAAHILRHQTSILVGVEGIKYRITAEPLLAGDAAIAIEIVEQEDFVHRMRKSGPTLQFSEAMGELGLEGFDGLAETANALVELLAGHRVGGHLVSKAGLIEADAGLGAARCGGIKAAFQVSSVLRN